MNVWLALLLVWVLAALMMTLGWRWQRRRANTGIVDVLWAAGLGGGALLLALLAPGAPLPRLALALAGGLWGWRLAWHLWRRVAHEPEDGRYRALREHWQGDQRKLFAFFQLQALLIPLFALPFVAVAANAATSLPWLLAGAAIWLGAVLGEAVADAQLARFRADPRQRGRTCREGLWRYSRHPNYFFEWLHWFAYVALAVGSPLAWLAWSGPVLMFLFLRFISGIPFTEAQALRTRGEDYRDYQRTTPMLFPWFPKRSRDPRTER
jgi:steroid 5-alpha reductase family enzyme